MVIRLYFFNISVSITINVVTAVQLKSRLGDLSFNGFLPTNGVRKSPKWQEQLRLVAGDFSRIGSAHILVPWGSGLEEGGGRSSVFINKRSSAV